MKKVVRFAKTNIIINISVLNQYDHIFVFLLFFFNFHFIISLFPPLFIILQRYFYITK